MLRTWCQRYPIYHAMDFTLEFLTLLLRGLLLFLPIFSVFLALIFGLGQIVGYLEDWSRFDSFYWSFITALTVGYGDIRPLGKWSKLLSIVIGLSGIMLTGIIVAIAVFAATRSFELHITHGGV